MKNLRIFRIFFQGPSIKKLKRKILEEENILLQNSTTIPGNNRLPHKSLHSPTEYSLASNKIPNHSTTKGTVITNATLTEYIIP